MAAGLMVAALLTKSPKGGDIHSIYKTNFLTKFVCHAT